MDPALKIHGSIGADDEYWAGLEVGEFRMSRCGACKTWMWPAHYRCGHCGSWDFEWVKMDPVGTVYTWTRTYYPFDRVLERQEDLPYVTILAEIPAAGNARVFGMLHGSEEGLKIGAPVRGVFLPASPKTKNYPTICWQLGGEAGA